jgi:hypothetical protein
MMTGQVAPAARHSRFVRPMRAIQSATPVDPITDLRHNIGWNGGPEEIVVTARFAQTGCFMCLINP